MTASLNQTGSTGRYIAYSQEIDRAMSGFEKEIHDFQGRKVSELLKSNPFNLSNKEGIQLAQREIQREFEGIFPQLSPDIFDQAKKDVATSILINLTQRAHKV
jgi:hypothetical protein